MKIYKVVFNIQNDNRVYLETSFFTQDLTEDEYIDEVYGEEESEQRVHANEYDFIQVQSVTPITELKELIS